MKVDEGCSDEAPTCRPPAGTASADATATNRASRRDTLLCAATKLFAARGYHGTTMDDVALAVGLNKATLYHYYESKSQILFDICQRAADFTVEAVHDDLSAPARETIFGITRRVLEGVADDIDRAAVFFQEGPYFSRWFTAEQVAYIHDRETQVHRRLCGVIDRGVASGEFSDCDAQVLALGYLGMTLGSYRWLWPLGRRTVADIAVEFSTALLRGLIRDQAVRNTSPLGI